MSATFSAPLPTRLRRRGEVVGLICGLLCFPFAFLGEILGALLPAGPAGVILPIVILSALAGMIACAIGRADETELFAGIAPRVGIRAGFVAALAGGALTVFAATLHAFGIGHADIRGVSLTPATLFLPHTPAFQFLLIAILGIPPSVFFGMAGAIVTAILRSPPQPIPADRAAKVPRTRPARSALLITLLLLSTVGYLSPVAVLLRPKPKPIFVAPAIQRPAKPKWRYQKPPGFDTAEAARRIVTDLRMIADVDCNLPVALSPNEKLFVYSRRNPRLTLEVLDLESLDVVASAEIDQKPSAITWSQDGTRLLFSTEGEQRRLQILDVGNSRLITLPQPVDERVPEGRPEWWDEQEVLFVADKSLHVLNLDNLRVYLAEDSSKWNALAPERQERIRRNLPSSHLPSNTRWRMAVHPALISALVPVDTAAKWTVGESLRVTFLDSVNSYLVTQPGADVKVGDLLLGTRDGTKFVRLRDNQASIFFFGLRDRPATHFDITMPTPPDSSLSDALAKKSICGFICAPLINPLNGKTVGPNRNRVKALARFAKWEDTDAQLWIEEDVIPVQPGDVIADIHTWEGRQPHAAGDLGKNEWFAVIDKLDVSSPPDRDVAPPLDRELSLLFNGRLGADRLDQILTNSQIKVVSVPQPKPEPPPPPAPPPAPETSPVPIPAPAFREETKPVIPQEPPETTVRRFIVKHHEKGNSGDWKGYAADFSEPVDFFGQGFKTRSSIFQLVSSLEKQNGRAKETPKSIVIIRQSATTYEARCVIQTNTTKNGKPVVGAADYIYTIELTPNGPQFRKMRMQTN